MSGTQQGTEETPIGSNNWNRLNRCIDIHVRKALLAVLHNDINHPSIKRLPNDPTHLYNYLRGKEEKLLFLKEINVLNEDQFDELRPQEGEVFSDKLDISLIKVLIRTFCGIKNDENNWKEPRPGDHSIAGAVIRAGGIRNSMCHYGNQSRMSDREFDEKWQEIENVLADLRYVEDISDFEMTLLKYKEECKKEELKNFIERKYINESTNQEETKIDILLEKNDAVMVTAEAGLGKTFSAQNLRYLWASDKIFKKKKLLYIDSKKVNKKMAKQPSNTAPVLVSELKHVPKDILDVHLGRVKETIEDLIVIIDGVDELSIGENVNLDFLRELEGKISNNERITAMETIISIYFGYFFPGSKIIVFGRKNEIGRLRNIEVKKYQKPSSLFNRQTCVVLKLQPLTDEGVKELIARATCKKTSCSCEKCTNTYSLVKDVEFRNVPSDLMAMIKIFESLPNPNFGRITKTKIFIIKIFNLLKNHTPIDDLNNPKTFRNLLRSEKSHKFRECIQIIAEVCFVSLHQQKVTIEVETFNENNVEYFRFKDRDETFSFEREIFEKLDLFYVRDDVILEPYHLTNMEFLASCYIYSDQKSLLLLADFEDDRKTIILPFVAGLCSNERFTKDFVSEVLQNNSNDGIDFFVNWLSNKDVHHYLPKSGWYGVKENGRLFPSFDLLERINKEVDIFNDALEMMKDVHTLVCHCRYDFEWYEMNTFKHDFSIINEKECRKIIRGQIEITNIKQFNALFEMYSNNQHEFIINQLTLDAVIPHDTHMVTNLKCNTLSIEWGCDSQTIDFILNALALPTTNTSMNIRGINCQRLSIADLSDFNSQQVEQLFTYGFYGVINSIELEGTFFEEEQIEIMKKMEHRHGNRMVNLGFSRLELNEVFKSLCLPNLGHRNFYLSDMALDDDYLNEFRKHISPGVSKKLSNFKIIKIGAPFMQKENYSQIYEQSMSLHLFQVDLIRVSPALFAKTFSLVSLLSCFDHNGYIPDTHWFRLSQNKDCSINELRIWFPKPENFRHFLNIKTTMTQFILDRVDIFEQLLSHIVNDPNQSYKEIKVFVVQYDKYDWDNYKEMVLFQRKTMEEYKDNYDSDNSKLDGIVVPFHKGKTLEHYWCCEISAPTQKHSKLELNVPLKKQKLD